MARRVFQFGDFQLDLNARALRRVSGEAVVLPALMFECIAWLIQHRDRAVGRDELIAAIWNSSDPSDNLLAQLVFRARKLLDDPNDEQSAIRTVPGFGYQWAAPTRLLEETSDSGEPALQVEASAAEVTGSPIVPVEASSASIRRRLGFVPTVFFISALLIALGVGAYVWQRSASRTTMPGPATRSTVSQLPDVVAVLPFGGPATSDVDWAWLRLGMMDLVASRLREGGLPVLPSSDVVAVVRDEQVANAAAEKFRAAANVRYVLLSTAARSDNGWTVHLELRDREGQQREVQATAQQVIDAAQQAADQLLDRLGKPARREAESSGSRSATELFQRVEASVLANRYDEARNLLESAPTDLRDSPELQLRLAMVDFRSGRIEAARDLFAKLLAERSSEKDPLLRAGVLNGLGAVNIRLGQAQIAEHYLTEAIALLADSNESAKLGAAYLWRGNAFAMQGQYDRTQSDWSKARIAFGNAGDVLALARLDANDGVLNTHFYRTAEALQLFQRAAEQFERFGANDDLSAARGNEIDTQLDLLQPAAALAVAERAGTRFDVLKNPLRVHWFKFERARAFLENGRLVKGRSLLDELAGEIKPNESGLLAKVQAVQAEADFRDGEFETALTLSRRSQTGLPAPQGPDEWSDTRIKTWLVMTRVLRGLRRDAEAATEVRKFRAWADVTADPVNKIQARLAEAEQTWSEGRHEAAMAIYDDLLRLVPREGGAPAYAANVALSYGSLLIGGGYLDRAAEVVGQVARFADQDFNCALLQVRLYHALGHRDAWQSALDQARTLAGERAIPRSLMDPPQ